MAARGPKIADWVWKGVYHLVFGRSGQLLLNKFFDPSTPSMRKVVDGEKKEMKRKERKENNDVYSGHYARTATTGPPHARANFLCDGWW